MKRIVHKLMNSKKLAFLPSIMIVVVALCLLFSPGSTYSTEASRSSIFMDIQASVEELLSKVGRGGPGVVMIVVYDDTGEEKDRGIGCFIDTEGRILTNAEMMKDAYSAEVFSVSNHYRDVTILNRDEDIDLAFLQVKATDEVALELDFEYKAVPGERVLVIGKSYNMENTASEGLINDVISIEKEYELFKVQTTAPISSLKASKDGPLLNQAGKVIGFTTRTITGIMEPDTIPWMSDDELNAIGVRSIEPFFTKTKGGERLHDPGSRIWFRWFISRVKTLAATSFIFLYGLGFPKIIGAVFVFILCISAIQWFYIKMFKKIRAGK